MDHLLLSLPCRRWEVRHLQSQETQQAVVFILFFFFSDLLLPLLLQIIFSSGQFVRGSVFFSSASGARSGGAANGVAAVVAATVVRPTAEATVEMGLLSMFRRRNGPIGVDGHLCWRRWAGSVGLWVAVVGDSASVRRAGHRYWRPNEGEDLRCVVGGWSMRRRKNEQPKEGLWEVE